MVLTSGDPPIPRLNLPGLLEVEPSVCSLRMFVFLVAIRAGQHPLLSDLVKDRPNEKDGVDTIIVVDGIPQVGPERFDKLQSVIMKFFTKFGTIINEYFPKNEAGHTKGYVFLEYANSENAVEAVNTANNHKLDKQHTFLVNLFTDFKKYEEIPDEWEPPQPQPYKEQSDLYSFLMDPDAYDQFSVMCNRGSSVQIMQNTAPEPTKLQERLRWTETFIQWSPLGTYLATFHVKGIALWGGPAFEQIMRFGHTGVQYIEFSPCERSFGTGAWYSSPKHFKELLERQTHAVRTVRAKR
ncbi:translation initiation factor eIF-3b like protein [Homalodisca vitripennis]|nr:translation initiation factor eIF-3b like protein [Homalodisca vitripennis]